MVLSMTGYGKATGTFENKRLIVEIRSLNSKSLDLYVRASVVYRELELEMRSIVAKNLDRGKVECSITLENNHESKAATINADLVKSYYADLSKVAEELNDKSTNLLELVMRMPEVLSTEKENLGDEEKAFVLNLVEEACAELNKFRKQEGDQLRKDFENNIGAIRQRLLEVPKFEQERIDSVKERMKAGLEKLTNKAIDENRLEQEIIFYIEKLDVSEEKQRLSHHLDYFLETMNVELCGKKLGFITQEIGREINTLGSKSYHSEMQRLVVEMKDYLEKIKEQVLNTL
jgi:uncharacterized protein (TIGR00255 family)